MDMIERVARAVAWDHAGSEDVWHVYRSAAKAAIAAMRDLTPEMAEAMGHMVEPACQGDGRWTSIREAWRAGIDAAIGDA